MEEPHADPGALSTASSTLRLDESVALAGALTQFVARSHGIRMLVIKGAPAEEMGLRPPRASSDVDVLVEPARAAELIRLLGERGWRPRDVPDFPRLLARHSYTLIHDEWNCDIDVHHYWPGFLAPAETAFEELWASHATASMAEVDVDVPDRAGAALVLALHSLREAGFVDPSSRQMVEYRFLVGALTTPTEDADDGETAGGTTAGADTDPETDGTTAPASGAAAEADAGSGVESDVDDSPATTRADADADATMHARVGDAPGADAPASIAPAVRDIARRTGSEQTARRFLLDLGEDVPLVDDADDPQLAMWRLNSRAEHPVTGWVLALRDASWPQRARLVWHGVFPSAAELRAIDPRIGPRRRDVAAGWWRRFARGMRALPAAWRLVGRRR